MYGYHIFLKKILNVFYVFKIKFFYYFISDFSTATNKAETKVVEEAVQTPKVVEEAVQTPNVTEETGTTWTTTPETGITWTTTPEPKEGEIALRTLQKQGKLNVLFLLKKFKFWFF